jgi:alpha 1,3-glucosidase
MPLTLKIFLDHNDTASGNIYLDDGISFDYEKGDYIYLKITFADGQLTIEDKSWSYQDQTPYSTNKSLFSTEVNNVIVSSISFKKEYKLLEGIKIGERGLKTTIKLND